MQWQRVVPDVYALAESPFWHPQEQLLYWLDIAGRKILRVRPDAKEVESWDMPCEPGCMAPAHGGGLVLALRDGIYRATQWGGALRRIATLPYDTASVRANDGKCDMAGRFWVGTIDETKANRAAALYAIDARGASVAVQRMAGDALTANGLAWSPDGHTLYWADTSSHVVFAWHHNQHANTLSEHRIHLRFAAKPVAWTDAAGGYGGRPDGAAVDVQGNYYVAMYEGGRLCKFAPDGALLAEIATPVQCPTMPCFGGADLRTLYLTSARQGRSEAQLRAYPHSGGIFSMRVEVPGLPVNFFAAQDCR